MGKQGSEMGVKTGWMDIKISEMVKADWNYKTEDPIKTQKLIGNFKRNGQVENLIVRELPSGFFEVVNGNHRLDVMIALNFEKAHVFNCGKISQAHAQRLAIETNETKFQTDEIALANLIKEIREEFDMDDLVMTMPFDRDDLENMEKLTSFDWDQYGKPPEDHEGEKEIKFVIVCQAEDEGIKQDLLEVCEKYPTAILR